MDAKIMPRYKTIFSLRIRSELRKRNIEPLMEVDNKDKPGFKCWKYEMTSELEEALSEIMEGGKSNGC